LHPSTRRDPSLVSTSAEASAVPQDVHDDVGWPLPASPTPSSYAVLALRNQPQPHLTALLRATRSPEQQLVLALSTSTSPAS
jgi:hypothetical protein